MCRVFVNYRTGDEEVCATLVDRELSAVFGDANVFRAGKSIPLGAQFEEDLLRNVWRSDVLVAVVGRRWLAATDRSGVRALDNPADWTRRELLEALSHQVLVIPLLVNGADRLSADVLPVELAELATRQYLRLDTRDIATGLQRLVERLGQECGGIPDPPAERPATPSSPTAHHGGIGSISGHQVTAVTAPAGPVNTGSGNQVVQHGEYGDGTTFVFGGRNAARQRFTRRDRDLP
ncbi:toll/interleukin-1 receptor domain-containing protein [Actinosynnema sp. NPDC047251]|uniref:TIR domain-containing protein n=1 Tax=Saccharothrix espanaensis (strain ATCC 51144 / DSM 44229 / JCM 9112 / NBRC 15066 / NRRL 15764) TaxID=1179773 RepID=K0KBF4_SACES|nr:toll/interleukin-1 receptor domain-containing protein [Saccharothrix espanaensis]CCH33973.1 hypothetical protein BN6_67360 [Saccharothrix espanaensis DSM 44229]